MQRDKWTFPYNPRVVANAAAKQAEICERDPSGWSRQLQAYGQELAPWYRRYAEQLSSRDPEDVIYLDIDDVAFFGL